MPDSAAQPPIALLVEDEPLIALALEDALAAAGFRVLLACGAAEALAAPAELLAVAVVDLRLGDGPDGRAVVAALRRRAPGLPVVVATGYAADAPQADLRGLGGPTTRLAKPRDLDELGDAVRHVIRRRDEGIPPGHGRRRGDRRV